MSENAGSQPPVVRRRPPWYKRKFLINYRIQMGYALAVAWIILTSILITAVFVYYTLCRIALEPEMHGRVRDALAQANFAIFCKLLILAGVMVGLSMVLTIYFLHRVVGPAYRIEKILKTVASGTEEIPTEIHLREKDELKPMATALESMLIMVKTLKDKEKQALATGVYPKENSKKDDRGPAGNS